MKSFLDELSAGLLRCQVHAGRLLVAVSGGADSVALLRGLVEVAPRFSIELSVAHFNHRLRGIESDDEADWVADLAQKWNLPCEVGSWSRNDHELAQGVRGIEETARSRRYQFLDDVASNGGCPNIAIAHTANDQAETVLHHLLRGTGLTGLAGIPTTRSTPAGHRLIRPLLGIRRAQVEQFLESCQQTFCTDPTNSNTAFTRNKLRHVVLPFLRDQINPQVEIALSRLAQQAAEINEVLQPAVDQLLSRCLIDQQPDACRIDTDCLIDQPRHLVREVFRTLWERQQWPRKAMGFDQWNRLVETLSTRETLTFPSRIEARYHAPRLLVLRMTGEEGNQESRGV